jgi:hypothetical protein
MEAWMARYGVSRRVALIVAGALALASGSLPVAHAASSVATSAAVSLRYRFKAGELLTYSMKTVEKVETNIAGQPADNLTTTVLYQARYVVHSVDSTGNATLSIDFNPGIETDVHNGKTSHTTVPADKLSSPADKCIQENDGTQYCVYRGAYGLNDVGQVSLTPVALSGKWKSEIDNTWFGGAAPVTLSNKLTTISTGQFGRVATVTTSMQTSGNASTTSGAKHYVTTTTISESGTWGIGVESGVFLDEHLSQTVSSRGTMTDGSGPHPFSQKRTILTTMQLLSTRSGPVQALGKAYSTASASPAGAGYSIDYPSSWRETDNGSGSYQIASPDKTALILGSQVATAGDVSNPGYVSGFLRTLGTPIGTIINAVRTVDGQQYGIADAVLRLSGQPLEAQCEVRVRANGSGVSIIAAIVSLGEASVNARTPDLAHEYEQVQRSLDSIHVVGSQV